MKARIFARLFFCSQNNKATLDSQGRNQHWRWFKAHRREFERADQTYGISVGSKSDAILPRYGP